MKNICFYVSAYLLVFSFTAFAETRFVSKTGASTPPYTSWATAADSIQKAINICKYGDTVYVGNGVYKEWVFINNGITLIGSGMDSCIIDTREMDRQWATVEIRGVGNVIGFSIFSSTKGGGTGIGCFGNDTLCKFENNRIDYADSYGITVNNCPAIIRQNIINSKDLNIRYSGLDWYPYTLIENNYLTGQEYTIYIPFFTKVIVRNNTFYFDYGGAVALTGSDHDTLLVYNNLVIAKSAFSGLVQSNRPSTKRNNLVFGNFRGAAMISYEGYNDVRNNLILSTTTGLYNWKGPGKGIQYNNSWGGVDNYSGFTPDSTNLSVDPMIVSDDTAKLDFHLQMFSPMIDAGDPSILDVDGTRSDIGLYGGPYGESYTYQDLAPRAPKNVTAAVNSTVLKINWAKNTEADFAYYRIYRDTIPGFIPDTTKRIAKTNDTSYTELFKPGKNYYYKISATDNQGNESPKSEEVKLITRVNEKPVIQAEDYILFANYPNPFNPSTRICYRLNKPGNVNLKVYDIKGSLVKQILNKWHEAGYYEEEFTGEKKQANDYIERFASGVYVLVMEVKNENNIPVYTNSRKMMMVK